jgi:hypothetical protein
VSANGFYEKRSAALVNWWWGLNLAGMVVGWTTMSVGRLGVEELHSMATRQVFLQLLQVATAILFLLMIRGAQKRQDEQWQDLERQRNVPKPTADALR